MHVTQINESTYVFSIHRRNPVCGLTYIDTRFCIEICRDSKLGSLVAEKLE